MEYLIIIALSLLLGTLVVSPLAVFLPAAAVSFLLIARIWQSVEQHDRLLRALGARGERPNNRAVDEASHGEETAHSTE